MLKIIELNKQAKQKGVPQSESARLGLQFIDPPKPFDDLMELTTKSGILKQCIEALVVGIYGVGYTLDNRYPDLEKDKQLKTEIIKESNSIEEFFESADISGKDSFNEFLRKVGTDIESTGNGYIEILFNRSKPYGFNHLRSSTMRLLELDDEIIFWDRPFYDLDSQSYRTEKAPNRFRRYLQINPVNGSYRYWKELGDPRIVDSITGKYWLTQEELDKDKLKDQVIEANQLWHFSLYSPSSDYGLPRWIGAINSVVGSILKEENDIKWFKNGCKSDLLISSTTPLSDSSIELLTKRVKESANIDNAHSTLLIFPDQIDSAMNEGNSKIDITELNQNQDSQYKEYDKANVERVISACRISKIHVGLEQDYNRATANSSLEVVENNTFLPSREKIDSFINNRIFPLLSVKYHIYRSQPSTKQSLKDKAEIIHQLSQSGATLRELRTAIEPLLGIQLTDINQEYLDYPLGIAIALIQNNQKQSQTVL